jgi:hypothetical protein
MVFKVQDPATGKVLEFANPSDANAYYMNIAKDTPDLSYIVTPPTAPTRPTPVPTVSDAVPRPNISKPQNYNEYLEQMYGVGGQLVPAPSTPIPVNSITPVSINRTLPPRIISTPTTTTPQSRVDAAGNSITMPVLTQSGRVLTADEIRRIQDQHKYYSSRGMEIPDSLKITYPTAPTPAVPEYRPPVANPELSNAVTGGSVRDSTGNQIGSATSYWDGQGNLMYTEEKLYDGSMRYRDGQTNQIITPSGTTNVSRSSVPAGTASTKIVPTVYMSGKDRVVKYEEAPLPSAEVRNAYVPSEVNTIQQVGQTTRFQLSERNIEDMKAGKELYLVVGGDLASGGNAEVLGFTNERVEGARNFKLNNTNIDWRSSRIDFGEDNSIVLQTPNEMVILNDPENPNLGHLTNKYVGEHQGILRSMIADVDWYVYDKQDAEEEKRFREQQKQQKAHTDTNNLIIQQYWKDYTQNQEDKLKLLKTSGEATYKPVAGTESFIYGTSSGSPSPKWGNVTASGDVVMKDMGGQDRYGSLYVTDKKAYFFVEGDGKGQVTMSGSMDAGIPDFSLVTKQELSTGQISNNIFGVPYAYKSSGQTLANYLTGTKSNTTTNASVSGRRQRYNSAKKKNQNVFSLGDPIRFDKPMTLGKPLTLGKIEKPGRIKPISFGKIEPISFKQLTSVGGKKPEKVKSDRAKSDRAKSDRAKSVFGIEPFSFKNADLFSFGAPKPKTNRKKTSKRKNTNKKKLPRLISFLED